ncbi:methyl-accepting chemotaxis protein [Thiomicrorhabdus xiamenensis]|uniref:PAS domain-containing protein n=1 Tax=Thiomicrorhabdus xiamenensis TaxID=2739063 RepID=A0A7D4NKN0_9GAMM|nr:methyl-accepting chemotaxis protein [Thiomicrorhabdus xiamenensis]QKI89349.1 PAS domain-containing protein [Thiomicrorhabdus xiamenensis]
MTDNLRLAANVNAEGRIDYINQDYIEWLGYSEEEILGQPTSMLRAPGIPEQIQTTIQEQVSKNHPVQFPIQEMKKNGETYWAEMTIQPIFEKGRYIGYTSIKRVVSDPARIAGYESLYREIADGKKVYTNGIWIGENYHKWMSRFGLQRASLLTKTLLAILLASLLIIAVAGFMAINEINEIKRDSADYRSVTLGKYVTAKMEKKHDIGITNAIGITFSDHVAKFVAERDQAALLKLLAEAGQSYSKFSDLKNVKLHFVDENGISYLKSWKPLEQQRMDDLSARSYIQKMSLEPKPLVTNALSSVGYNIKSIVPVFYQGRYEGFVEFIQGVGSLRRDFEKQDQLYLAAMSVDYALKGDQFRQKNAKNRPVSSDDKWVVGNNQQFSSENSLKQIELLKRIDIDSLFSNGYFVGETYFHASTPIKSQSGELMGYHILSEPVAAYNDYVGAKVDIAIQAFMNVVITVVILALIIAWLLWLFILKPLKNVQRTMDVATAQSNLFARVRYYAKDEIGQLGMAYNRQVMLSQCIIAESNAAMEELVKGRLDYRIRTPFESDYDMLKGRINHTCEVLQDTFGTLGEVMENMQKGNFRNQSQHNLTGEYALIVERGFSAIQNLAEVFSEINKVMGYAARGKLDERILNFQQGDIENLQKSINQSLVLIEQGFSDVVQASERMAEGDFSQPISGDYEYALNDAKTAVNASMERLTETMMKLRQAAFRVYENTENVVEGTQSLNQRTQSQAASLEETSAAMEQTTAQIRSNLDNTIEASNLSNQQSQKLGMANSAMEDTRKSMQGIQESSQKIRDITVLIDSIAFQTNLLALNAAVEAARAGEHGRGFAVVAGEVRNLAGKSAEATKEIEQLIQASSAAIDIGVQQVDRVGESLREVTDITGQVQSIISEVERASKDQSVGVEEVNKSITHIDSVTQQNAALVEETTASTEGLKESADTMQSIIKAFKLKSGVVEHD